MRLLSPLLAAVLVLSCGPAFAQSVCSQLQGQLAALDRSGASQAQVQQARIAFDAASRQAQQAGCLTLLRIFAPPQCRGMLQNLDALRANLDTLQRAAATQAPAGARAAIVAALQANGCTTGGGGGATRRDTFRTVCVRPTDGYFFPVSFATTTDRFGNDQAYCESLCEGGHLFAYPNPGGDIEDAVDIAGQRYAEMPFAFAYRTAYDPSAQCLRSHEVAAQTPSPPVSVPANPAAMVPVPIPRPVRSEDPETLANRAGGLQMPDAEGETEGVFLTANGVRLIGPAFYYAQ